MAILFLTRLDLRLNERDTARINGQLITWYRSLRAIYCNVYFKIKETGQEEQEEKLNALFEKARNYLSPASVNNPELSAQITNIAVTNVENVLDEIDLLLNTLLYEYGLIFPKENVQDLGEALKEGVAG